MALDAAAIRAIYSALKSHAQVLATFPGGTTGHEPLSPPGNGLAVAVLRGPLGPARGGSGLAATSMRLEFTVRIYSARAQPSDDIDETVLAAECALMAAYTGDLDLAGVPDGLIRMVDVLGAYGSPLESVPGWLEQDGRPMRVTDITVPLVINDAWAQEVT